MLDRNVRPTSLIKALLPWIILVSVLAVSLWMRSLYLWVQELSSDEGHWLMFGLLANAGYPAYTTTFVGIPPLALLTIQLGAQLFGTTLAVRYPMMLFSLVGIGSIFWSLQPHKSRFGLLAGLLAALFLSFDSEYFHASCSIMAEVPAVALALLSLTLAQQYYFEQKGWWLFLSGMAFTLSLALKIFVIFIPLLVGFLIVLTLWPSIRPRHGGLGAMPLGGSQLVGTSADLKARLLRQLALAVGLWVAGVAVPLAIFMIVYNPQAMYQEVFVFRLELREVMLKLGQSTSFENIALVGQMLVNLSPLLIGALSGIVFSWRQRRWEMASWLTWFILAVILLLGHIPLRERYSVMLLPPLAALSGVSVASIVNWLRGWPNRELAGPERLETTRLGRIVPLLLLAGLMTWIIATPVRSATLPPAPDILGEVSPERRAAVEYAMTSTTALDCIVTDDQRFAMAAGRLTPPGLSETTHARLLTGRLTLAEVIDQLNQYDCPLVAYADRKFIFDRYLPDLRVHMRNLYFLEIPFDRHTTIYTGKKQVTRPPTIPLEAQLGEVIALLGIDLSSAVWYPGQDVPLAVYWAALQPLDRDYKIFMQLRNSRSETVLSADHFPFPAPPGNYPPVPTDEQQAALAKTMGGYPDHGMLPTRSWPIGSSVREVTTLHLPVALPAGTYQLYAGLYDPDTLIRLPVRSRSGESDEFLLATINVAEIP